MSKGLFGVICGILVAVIIFIIAMVAASLKRLESDEVGLKYNNFQKDLGDTPYYSGLHTGPPGYSFIKFPSVFRTMQYDSVECLNKDGVEISLSVTYQFRVRAKSLEKIILQFREYENFKRILTYVGESALHDSASQFNTSQFQAERGRFQEDLRQRLVTKYDSIDIDTDVTDLQVNNIGRPRLYENTLAQKETAREDIEVAKNERPQALTEADTKLKKAETQATIDINEANSRARILNNAFIHKISYYSAQADAEAIINQYNEEAATYKRLVSSDGLNLDSEGLLAYVGIRAIENAHKPVMIGLNSPAKASYVQQ